MSAYMVEDKTINKIVAKLGKHLEGSYHLRKELRAIDMDFSTDSHGNMTVKDYSAYLADFARAMFNLNVKSVNARYGEGEAEKFRPLDYKYTPEYNITNISVLKGLECYLYQSCEGMCVYSPLYKFLDGVYKPFLMAEVIRALPEYDQANWG